MGGIQEKVIAARRENVKTVLMWVTSEGEPKVEPRFLGPRWHWKMLNL